MIKSNQVDQKVLKVTTKEKLRSLSDHTGVFSDKFYLEDLKEEFYYDPTDTTTPDNSVDVFVNIATNRRYKLWKSPTVTAEINNISNVEIPVAVSDRLPYKTLSQVRSAAAINYTDIRITDKYKEGVFRYDSTDTTSTDDGALVIVNTATGRRYKRVDFDTVDVRWFGVIADGTTDNRTTLQAAFDNTVCKNFLIPKTTQPYRISNSVQIPSNTKIFMEPGVDIFGMGTNTNHTFRMDNAENIKIEGYGATIRDVYEAYPENSQFFGSIAIRSSKKVTIRGLIIKDTGGDGIYIGNASGLSSSDITLEDLTVSRVSRNGISITNVNGIVIRNCHFHSIDRMFPKAGIDIEPNYPSTDRLSNIFISDIKTENCGAGIIIAAAAQENRSDMTVDIINHNDTGSRYGLLSTTTTSNGKGTINVVNPIWRNNKSAGYMNAGCNPEGIRINIYSPVIENPFYENGSGEYGFYAAILLYRHSSQVYDLPSLGNIHIYNPYISDDVVPEGGAPRVQIHGILARDFNSKPWTNITIEDPKLIKVNGHKLKLDHAGDVIIKDRYEIFHQKFTSAVETISVCTLQATPQNYVTKITNRVSTGENTVNFLPYNLDGQELEIINESSSGNRITLVLPTGARCPDLQPGTTTGFYSTAQGDRIVLKYLKAENRFTVLSIRGVWYARSNDAPLTGNSTYHYQEISSTIGIGTDNKPAIVLIKAVPTQNMVVGLPPANRMKGRTITVKRDAPKNDNVVRLYVNTNSADGTYGTINQGTRQLDCLPNQRDCITLLSDGTDYKVLSWHRGSMTVVSTASTGPDRTELNTQYGYEKEGFAVYNTNIKKTYTKLSPANNSPWIETDWDTGVITQMP